MDVFGIFNFKLRMDPKDCILDVKQLVEQGTGISHTSFKLQHGQPGNFDTPDVGQMVGDFSCAGDVRLFASSPTIDALKVANHIKEQQATAKTQGGIDIDGLAITPDFVCLTCQKEVEEKPSINDDALVGKDFSVLDVPASSSDNPRYQSILGEFERAEAEFLRMKNEHKARVKALVDESRSVSVGLRVRFISGREIDVQTSLKKTVKKFKEEDLSEHINKDVVLVFGTERLQTNRRLFAYGIREGSVLEVAVFNPTVEHDFHLKVAFVEFIVNEDGVRTPTPANSPYSVNVTPTTTVFQLIGTVLAGLRQFNLYQEHDRRFLYFLNGHLLNAVVSGEDQNGLVKDFAVGNDLIAVNVYDKNDRVYRIAVGEPVNDENSSSDEEDFEEVWGEGDDFTFLADYNFDVGDGTGYIEPINRDEAVEVVIYPNTKDKNMRIKLFFLPTATVKQVMDEINDITNIETGTFGLFNPINGEKLSEASLVSECPSEMLIKLKMMGGGSHRDLQKVALKSKNLKDKIVSIRASSTSTAGVFPQVLQLEEK